MRLLRWRWRNCRPTSSPLRGFFSCEFGEEGGALGFARGEGFGFGRFFVVVSHHLSRGSIERHKYHNGKSIGRKKAKKTHTT
jgi:hypothetical protein